MTTIQVKVTATTDDGTERIGANILTNIIAAGTDTVPVYNGFVRFLNVTAPQGATVDSATLTLNITGITGTPNTTLYGVDADNAAAFSYPGNTPSSATKTTATADPDPAGTGTKVITITTIVQEIIDRGGWASGNAMAFVFINNDAGTSNFWQAEDYDSAGTAEATLDIAYTVIRAAAAQLTGSLTVAASASRTASAASAVSTAATIAPTAGLTYAPGAALSAAAALAPLGTQDSLGAAVLATTGALTADGNLGTLFAASALVGSATLAVLAAPLVKTAAAALSASALLTASATRIAPIKTVSLGAGFTSSSRQHGGVAY